MSNESYVYEEFGTSEGISDRIGLISKLPFAYVTPINISYRQKEADIGILAVTEPGFKFRQVLFN
jgi:hypothetical protein